MKQFYVSICFIISFLLFYKNANCQIVAPKAPKVAIVTAGASKKVCGVNTTTLEAQIPDWINGEWQGDNFNNYSNRLNPITAYTNTSGFIGGNYYNPGGYRVIDHYFIMKIPSIVNSSQFQEKTTNVFYPQNDTPSFKIMPWFRPGSLNYVQFDNPNHISSWGWVCVDGPSFRRESYFQSLFDLYVRGTYQIKAAVLGCTTKYITTSFVVSDTTLSTTPVPYQKTGFLEVQVEPVGVLASYLHAGIYHSVTNTDNGQVYGINNYQLATYNTGNYSISTVYPGPFDYPFDSSSITALPPVSVNISANSHQVVTRRHEYRKGRLTVVLTSSSCNNNNENFTSGAWSIDGVSFYSSFSTIDIPIGNHTVYFKDVEGYVSPETATITIEGNKRTVVLAQYQKTPPCGRTDFGNIDDIEQETEMRYSENAACNSANFSRFDYHRYDSEKILCPTTRCSKEQVWNLYKSKISNQAPITGDFIPVYGSGNFSQGVRTAFAKALFPDPTWNPNSPIESGKRIDLFSPESYAALTGAFCLSGGAVSCITWVGLGRTLAPVPTVYSNPIALYVDEQNKCVTNYTLPDHFLYPGRVTRCIVEECGQIKVKTFGNGFSKWINPVGWAVGKINILYGKYILFENVNDRFFSLVNQTFPPIRITNENAIPILNPVGIENKTWVIKEFKVKHPNVPEMTIFDKNGDDKFWNLKTTKFTFNTNGTYDFTNIQNQQATGVWSTNGSNSITTDGITADLISVNSNEFVVSGTFKSFVDSNLVDAQYTYVFQLESALPVELVDFQAFTKESDNLLTWRTASEINNKGYEIQRQNSQRQFETIGFVAAKGKASNYEFIDKYPLSISYYRLRQIDFDDKETFSKIVSVVREEGETIDLYPNPTNGKVYIKSTKFQSKKVKVFNSLGQVLIEKVQIDNEIDMGYLPTGIYYIELWSENKRIQKRIFKN